MIETISFLHILNSLLCVCCYYVWYVYIICLLCLTRMSYKIMCKLVLHVPYSEKIYVYFMRTYD